MRLSSLSPRLSSRLILPTALLLLAAPAQAAFVIYYSGPVTGGGVNNTYAGSTTYSGTMITTLPRFNPLLGTLTQADFEWAPNINAAWQADPPPSSGTMSFSLTGPADVGGQSLGNVTVSISGPIVDNTPIPYGGISFGNATFTSGAFFAGLSTPGTETVTWNYAGSSTLSTPAVGVFDWGGSAHVLYTYTEVPEPASLALLSLGAAAMLVRRRVR